MVYILSDDNKTRSIAVDEVLLPYGPYFPVGEEPGDRQRPLMVLDRLGIMVRLAVEVPPAAAAGDEKTAARLLRLGGHSVQEMIEILRRGLGVADLELQGLPHLEQRTHHQRIRVGIEPHQIADEEIAALEGILLLVHD